MNPKIKVIILFLSMGLMLYGIFAFQEASICYNQWKLMEKLNFEAYVVFSLLISGFYYIDLTWNPNKK